MHDEIFGPVAAIQTFTEEDDVIRRANDTEYGLVAYVFTDDMRRGMRICEQLEYGMVGLNRGLVSDPGRPLRWGQAIGARPGRWPRRHARVHGDPIHLGQLVRDEAMGNVVASPSVRALALQRGIDLAELAEGLGRETIAREDLDAATGPSAPPAETSYWDVDHAAYGPVTEERVSRFAQTAARNLSAAASVIPTVTHHDSADITAIEELRARLKPEALARGIKLTALAFQVKALARALGDFPNFNASLTPDGETLVLKGFVHVGIAVDTPHGLTVPVLRDVDKKGLWAIASEIADLAARARARKVGPDEMGGGSMTISSIGSIGGEAFTPIINPPEVAILGITRAELRPVWNGEAFVPRPMLPLDLSYDHRVINGADAARFMRCLCDLLADPRRMMV